MSEKLAAKLHRTMPPDVTPDVIPISLWLWLSFALFALCLVGTLLWVYEPPHSPEAEEQAKSDKQPLELTGV